MSFIPEIDGKKLPRESQFHAWAPQIIDCSRRAGRCCDTFTEMTRRIEHAGFLNHRVEQKKWPIGPWPKDKQLKEIGFVNGQHWKAGMEGWAMWLLTKFGVPYPWTKEEVQVFAAQMRNELNNSHFPLWHRV